MAATKENPIIFYDIHSNEGSWSPNTYKTRLTLNYKGLPYRVEYVSMAEIESKLKELGVPPSTHNPFFKYILPMIADPSSDPNGKPTYVVESFEIALYLDEKYPAPKYPIVVPPGTRALQKIASERVMNAGMAFAAVVLPLAAARPNFLDDKSYEYYTQSRKALFGRELVELLPEVDSNWAKAKGGWDALGDELDLGGKDGPFVMGAQISFIDFVVGGLLHGLQKCEGGEMKYWKDMSTWQGGRWAAFWGQIAKLEADSSEVSA
ncbi:hypothetical protein B0J17DRAFT_660724 [Rhizoctonia solani]|nr:hypothetical protein B0J17DRAFT_660724 [Rhizoctonia solani]